MTIRYKSDVVNHLREQLGLTEVMANNALQAVMDYIASEVVKGNEVRLYKFGTFKTQHYNARSVWVPTVGEILTVGSADVPKFKPSTWFANMTKTKLFRGCGAYMKPPKQNKKKD